MKNIKTIKLLANVTKLQQYAINEYLRFARNLGDTENINHTQYYNIKRFRVNFIEIEKV